MLKGSKERSLLLLSSVAIARGAADIGCSHILGSSGSTYRWALQNPQLVAPVLLDYDVLEYKSPLMATLTGDALVVSAAADMTANFNLTSPTASSTPQKYLLQSIQLRKPGLIAEGTKQELSHELEAVLVHREVTGSGYFANVIVPIEVSSEPSLDLLAPLLNEAELPAEVGEMKPVLVSQHLPLKLADIFTNVSFQHFWGQVTTSCNNASAGARFLMRNVTLATSKSRLQRVLSLLKYAPEKMPTEPPAQTWMLQPCKRGSVCSIPAAANLAPQLQEAQSVLQNDTKKLEQAKQAMDESLLALTSNSSQVSNEVHNTAVRNRDNLRNAQAAVDGALRSVETLQEQINSAASAVFDSDAPAAATAASTAATATAATTTTTVAPAVSAKPALLAASAAASAASAASVASCAWELSQAEHVADAPLLFWRLGSSGLRPAEAAKAESAAAAPRLRLANLGDRLRITSLDGPLLVLLAQGEELPITYADVSPHGAGAQIQLVHLASKAEVLNLDMELGEGTGWLEHLGALPRAGETAEVQGADPMTMHPAFQRGVAGHYYRYNGQKEPCANVRWHILEERGHVSSNELAALQAALGAPPSALPPMLLRGQRRASSFAEVRAVTTQADTSPSSPSLKSLLLSLPRRAGPAGSLSP